MSHAQRKLKRAEVLLQATLDMLKQAEAAHFVESPLEMVMHYDGADCDGSCLKDDIEDWQRMRPVSANKPEAAR